MESRISRSVLRILSVLALTSCFALWVVAQKDGDPDSPTPVLLGENKTTRALAQKSEDVEKVPFSKIAAQAFDLNSKIVLYVGNLELMKDEGANALRVYAVDKRGRTYRFPVLDVKPVTNTRTIPGLDSLHAITVRLTDEIRYWGPPEADGDLLIYVTWRGLASNTAKLGVGKIGGEIKEPANLVKSASQAADSARTGDRFRFLQQAAFGPTPALDSLPSGMPLRAWITQQFAAAYPTNAYPNQPLQPNVTPPLTCDGSGTDDVPPTCFWDTYTMYPIQTWNSKEALYGTAQLRHRVAWALSQIWVTSGVDVQQSRHVVEYHKILSTHAFGNFRDLMGPTVANNSNSGLTLNPAMGEYLSMVDSTRTNPNENYAREIMQLFTIGLFMLNQDGTLQLDVDGDPIPTYDQNVVNNLTEVLTGWKFCPAASCPGLPAGTVNYIDPLIMTATTNHDITAKTLLTYPGSDATMNVLACGNCTNLTNTQNYARQTMIQALNNIFDHPNVGPFIGKLLIQHMVTSDPTPAYVGRVAAAFNNNGAGVRGDMKAVITAILLDPEARGNVKTDPNYGKLREPFQFATNFFRSLNVRDAAGTGQSDGVFLNNSGTYNSSVYSGMGQVPYRSPTVFNYYPPDFVIPGTATLGPEFALMTTGTAIQRTNFVNRMVGYNTNGTLFTGAPIPINTSPNAFTPSGTSLDLSDLHALSTADASGVQLMDELNRRMMNNTMSPTMRARILTVVLGVSSGDAPGRVRQAIYLIATSSQYQVQR